MYFYLIITNNGNGRYVCVHTRCADSVKEGNPTPAMATASGSPAAKGGADVSNGGSNERTASSNGRTTLKSGSRSFEGTRRGIGIFERYRGTPLRKDVINRRNVLQTVPR